MARLSARDSSPFQATQKTISGVFVTLEEPSKDMITEAVSSGYYHSDLWQRDYTRIQILTIEELSMERESDRDAQIHLQPVQAGGKGQEKRRDTEGFILVLSNFRIDS